jgi:outer membrane protein TolC
MQYLTNPGKRLSAVLLALVASATPVFAQDLPAPFCEVVIHDEAAELEDARIAVDLARSDFAAYEKIFKMIEGLQEAGTIPHMDYLKAKYDRDAAKLALEASDLILERQAALVEQYRLICNKTASGSGPQERAGAIRKAYARYRQADCNSLAKAIEVAATRLEFNREFLKKTVELRREKFATNTQVVLAELDVDREEKNLADAKHRTATCRSELPAN